jgi:hypothetical protein
MSVSLKAMAWFSMIARPNCVRFLGVLQRVFVGCTGDADGLRPTAGREASNVAMAGCA